MTGLQGEQVELLFRRLVDECRWFGVTTAGTYEAVEKVIDSLAPHPSDPFRLWERQTPAERR